MLKKESGIYTDLSNEDYHKCEGLSSSAIKLLLDCPARYYYRYLDNTRKEKEDTKALMIGSAFHTAVLEPEKFDERYVKMPKCPKNTKKGAELYNKIVEENPGKIYLPWNIWPIVDEMQEAVFKNNGAMNILADQNKKIEFSHFALSECKNVMLKSRPDFYNDFMILDLKSADSINRRDFESQIYKRGYHIQAALAIDILKITTGIDYEHFVMLTVEKTPPYLSCLYALDNEAIAFGRSKYQEAILIYLDCIKRMEWPSYTEEIEMIGLPKWAQ